MPISFSFALPLPIPIFRIARYSFSAVALLSAPSGLPNARDLASAAPSLIRPGRLFRGATPANLSHTNPNPPPEVLHFLRTADLLVDLRSNDERRLDDRQLIAWACGQTNFHARERHISILNKRRVVAGLFRVLPRHQLRALIYQIVSNPRQARLGVVQLMDQGGLLLLNRILVEAGASAIGYALNVITDTLQSDDASVFFYCSAGKDRTGLLAALILKVIGVDEHDIIFDYARSAETWERGPHELRADYIGMYFYVVFYCYLPILSAKV